MKDCNQCGKCCIKYSNGGLSVTPDEVEAWAVFQPDIHDYVLNGEIWFDPKDGSAIEVCPWLNKSDDGRSYHCGIYFDRPADCRHYPVTITQMVEDDCEMIEIKDLQDPATAQRQLDKIMSDSRPALVAGDILKKIDSRKDSRKNRRYSSKQ
ncbi:MAG: YkgJ family cysteine cluster protein [Pseudomonadales bacterium]